MGAIIVLCVLFGVWMVIAAIRRHPRSEAGSLTGLAGATVQLLGIATGVFTIAIATAGNDPDTLLVLFKAFLVVYVVLAVVGMLAMFSGSHR